MQARLTQFLTPVPFHNVIRVIDATWPWASSAKVSQLSDRPKEASMPPPFSLS
jgi:hypothetical protein